ncbi:MAG: hypothetical protein LC679_06840 [Intrasporangiaceae bacterium]|nr:hypothetical protein [Intrasporangiaceae bacterium]
MSIFPDVEVGADGEAAPNCTIDGCTDRARAYGWCNAHYARWKNHGDPQATSSRHLIDAQPIIDRVVKRGGIGVVLGLEHHQASGNRPLDPGEPTTKDRDVHRWSRQWQRMVKRGTISIDGADKFCIRVLGVNPALVFGSAWWDEA